MTSPLAEEVAMFRAFSRMVATARRNIVVIDTAATGHTLLLMDKTCAYYRETTAQLSGQGVQHLATPLMRLQNASSSKVIPVTLPDETPVTETAALQVDLRDAHVEPWVWVINQSLAASVTHDPVLIQRAM